MKKASAMVEERIMICYDLRVACDDGWKQKEQVFSDTFHKEKFFDKVRMLDVQEPTVDLHSANVYSKKAVAFSNSASKFLSENNSKEISSREVNVTPDFLQLGYQDYEECLALKLGDIFTSFVRRMLGF